MKKLLASLVLGLSLLAGGNAVLAQAPAATEPVAEATTSAPPRLPMPRPPPPKPPLRRLSPRSIPATPPGC